MNKQLAHLTLLTSHLRQSPRREVGKDTIDFLRPAIINGGGKLGDTGWSVQMIEGAAPGSCGFTLHHSGLWLFSCYVAWTHGGSAAMWPVAMAAARSLSGQFAQGQDRAAKPTTLPWLAVLMMPDALMGKASPGVMMEAGDLERCVAWTAIETLADKEAA